MSFKVGDRIECNWKHHGANFRGTVSAVNGDLHDIKFDDGDFEGQVPLDRLRPASSEEHKPSRLGSWPGSAPPKNWPSSSSTRELDADDISQDSEAYRRWKEGGTSSSTIDVLDKPLYETNTPYLIEKWKEKSILSLIMTIVAMIPYISYPVWILHFTALRGLEGIFTFFTGHQATAPNIQFDLWGFYGSNQLFDEWTFWGTWYWGGAGYLPTLPGFLLLFTFSYFAWSTVIPKFRGLQFLLLTLLWVYIQIPFFGTAPDTWINP